MKGDIHRPRRASLAYGRLGTVVIYGKNDAEMTGGVGDRANTNG